MVGEVFMLEIAYRYGGPFAAPFHLYLFRFVRSIYQNIEFGNTFVAFFGHKMHLIVAPHLVHRQVVAALIHINKGVRVHGSLLTLVRVANIHLIG